MKRFGVSNYTAVYEERFHQNLRRYTSQHQRIKRRIERILSHPYINTEALGDASGRLNLLGSLPLS